MAEEGHPRRPAAPASVTIDPARVAAVGRSERFAQLGRARGLAAVVGLSVFAAWYGAFLVLAAVAPHFMGRSLHRHLTVAYAWALSLILLTWVLVGAYLRYASRRLDPLVRETLAEADEPGARP